MTHKHEIYAAVQSFCVVVNVSLVAVALLLGIFISKQFIWNDDAATHLAVEAKTELFVASSCDKITAGKKDDDWFRCHKLLLAAVHKP